MVKHPSLCCADYTSTTPQFLYNKKLGLSHKLRDNPNQVYIIVFAYNKPLFFRSAFLSGSFPRNDL